MSLYNAASLTNVFSKTAKSFSLNPALRVNQVSIDSRTLDKRSMFFALKGERYDGHDFITNAIDAGASCVVLEKLTPEIEEKIKENGISYIQVESTLEALHDLARYNRNVNLPTAKVIAITGSMGKSGVRRLISEVLSKFYPTASSEKSFNNHIGVPLTLVNVEKDNKVIVLEMGMNHLGELTALSKLAKPNIVIITTIAPAHIGNFDGNIENIVKAKSEIFAGMGPDGIVFLNAANDHHASLMKYAKEAGLKNIFSIGAPEKSRMYISSYEIAPFWTMAYNIAMHERDSIINIKCRINSVAFHNAFNTLFAFAVARLFKCDLQEVSKIISSLPLIEGRGNVEYLFLEEKKIYVINDAYNASPEAMRSAIEVCGILKKQSKQQKARALCFLADMLELGEEGISYHTQLLQTILDSDIDKVYTVGTLMKSLHDILPEEIKGEHFSHAGFLSKKIKSFFEDGDIALFKGSKSMNLSSVILSLYK